MAKKILHLTLKKKWFDLIKEGKKKEEYREIKPYWEKRLCEKIEIGTGDNVGRIRYIPKKFDEIHFRNGYKPDSPYMVVEWKGLLMNVNIDDFKEGDFDMCFAIQLGKVLELRELI